MFVFSQKFYSCRELFELIWTACLLAGRERENEGYVIISRPGMKKQLNTLIRVHFRSFIVSLGGK